jgi:hypothetical protein
MKQCCTSDSQKVPGILWNRRIGAPWVRSNWAVCYRPFIRASFAEEAAWQEAGRDSGFCFCFTIKHLSTHRLLRQHSTIVFTRSHSEWHWLFPHLKMGLKAHVSQPWRTSNLMRQPNSGRFQKKPSNGASNNGRIDGASACVRACAQGSFFGGKRCRMSHHYSVIPPIQELTVPIVVERIIRQISHEGTYWIPKQSFRWH